MNNPIRQLKIPLLSGLLALSCAQEQAVPIVADFSLTVLRQDFSVPVQVMITNTTTGADTYAWTFEGGEPATSASKNPGTIVYDTPGTFAIRLEATNRDGNRDIKTAELPIEAKVEISFTTAVVKDPYPPMEVMLTNTSAGAKTYAWSFQGGVPSVSIERNPPNVVFANPGQHLISLTVSNSLESYTRTDTVVVAPHLQSDFDYEVAFADDDYQAPVTVTVNNKSISATHYSWLFEGGVPASSNAENPTVTFTTSGLHTLSLEAANGKTTQRADRTIAVHANTNIRFFKDIYLGVNSAHNADTIPAFFSTVTRQRYTQNQVNATNSALIDIVFFGLNKNFTQNLFIAPNVAHQWAFDTIAQATNTVFINLQEFCSCTASLTAAAFDAMTNDQQLAAMTITPPEGVFQSFSNTMLPRIVLFKTHDGRKGAIKVKAFVEQGSYGYVDIDIKVMKKPR